MKTILFFITALFFTITSTAQQFVDKAVIEYEVNGKKNKVINTRSVH